MPGCVPLSDNTSSQFSYPDDICTYIASVATSSGSLIVKDVAIGLSLPVQYIWSPVAVSSGAILVCEKTQPEINKHNRVKKNSGLKLNELKCRRTIILFI